MQFTLLTATLLASLVSARDFTLYNDANFKGGSHRETRGDDGACWNLNGKGDQASSVKGLNGCTTFFRERDCTGSSWNNWGDAATVPSFLNDHIWSFRNSDACCDHKGRSLCLASCTTGCAPLGNGAATCIENCRPFCKGAFHCISG
ncbi:uncharacterized protein FIESC28_07705 [Fusarium coffeatum]|uniref:Uncharacterized protein n=1 Tax=Fusarium coffeatum TaxID=231269 RepID=A0A366RBC5_9HYPO|nr:uncharacterized protein FIESC28_07705 [Fusarium coffeatum]RBR14469.1 hypothetical protein FIESC28_07705 [Fusarium coffeatum]